MKYLQPCAGFSIPEVVMAMCVGAIAITGGMALNQQQLRLVKSSRESNGASLALEERIEQLRIATWRQMTDAGYLQNNYFTTQPKSANALGTLTERIRVTAFPDETVCTGILMEREPSGRVTVLLSGSGLAEQRLAKVTVQNTWRGNGRVRTRELATIISNGGISRMNLPAMGTSGVTPASAGGTSTTTPSLPTPAPTSTATPIPIATPTPVPTSPGNNGNGNGKGRGNVGGKTGTN